MTHYQLVGTNGSKDWWVPANRYQSEWETHHEPAYEKFFDLADEHHELPDRKAKQAFLRQHGIIVSHAPNGDQPRPEQLTHAQLMRLTQRPAKKKSAPSRPVPSRPSPKMAKPSMYQNNPWFSREEQRERHKTGAWKQPQKTRRPGEHMSSTGIGMGTGFAKSWSQLEEFEKVRFNPFKVFRDPFRSRAMLGNISNIHDARNARGQAQNLLNQKARKLADAEGEWIEEMQQLPEYLRNIQIGNPKVAKPKNSLSNIWGMLNREREYKAAYAAALPERDAALSGLRQADEQLGRAEARQAKYQSQRDRNLARARVAAGATAGAGLGIGGGLWGARQYRNSAQRNANRRPQNKQQVEY